MKDKLKPFSYQSVELIASELKRRAELNRKYVMSLDNEDLLRNYYIEAGLWTSSSEPENIHGGWENPTCQLRGHFLGHWLSAAAKLYAATEDHEVKAKADKIISELERCQKENGGEWAGSIPEKYLDWIAKGKSVWAPHYTIHKTMMGLWDMYKYANNEQALNILVNWAKWFTRWTSKFSREQMDDILDFETGGMLEIWADLYSVTGNKEHLDLLYKYDRPRLFEPLLEGRDVLTNMHANTTIPEILGAARAWEVMGDNRWRKIVEAYWNMAVTLRGTYCTGGQTCGEIWTPKEELAERLGDKNQEHCTVYNMMRLAEFLFKWTGDVSYADYWELNLYNGILAQQHPDTGMITYFLPLEAGSKKKWGTPRKDFWCCHGTLVQAHAAHGSNVYYEDEEGLIISQYIPAKLTWKRDDCTVTVNQTIDVQSCNIGALGKNKDFGKAHRPNSVAVLIEVDCEKPVEFALKIRLPWWLKGEACISVNGQKQNIISKPSSFCSIKRQWKNDKVYIELPKGITISKLAGSSDMVAFLDGPVVLAGLCDDEITLYSDGVDPESLLVPHNEREWGRWLHGYKTRNQEKNIKFIPLYEVRDEKYTVYFPIKTSK